MDKEPFIIKSGKGHSVEIEQGSTHARRKTNVIAPQEDSLEDRVVKESVQEERKLADLGLQGDELSPGKGQATASERVDSALPVAGASQDPVAEGGASAAGQASVQADAATAGSAQDGPVIVQEARAEEDARAAKADTRSDRYLSGDESRDAERDARGPKEEVMADRFASDHPDALPDEELRGPGQPGVPMTNRQKVDSLQSQANRIQIEQAQSVPSERPVERQEDDQALRPTAEAEPSQAAAPAGVDEEKLRVAAASGHEGLPPELEGNLGFTPAAPAEAPGSSLLARVRALRSNMSVTDDRLSKLQGKPPVKP